MHVLGPKIDINHHVASPQRHENGQETDLDSNVAGPQRHENGQETDSPHLNCHLVCSLLKVGRLPSRANEYTK